MGLYYIPFGIFVLLFKDSLGFADEYFGGARIAFEVVAFIANSAYLIFALKFVHKRSSFILREAKSFGVFLGLFIFALLWIEYSDNLGDYSYLTYKALSAYFVTRFAINYIVKKYPYNPIRSRGL